MIEDANGEEIEVGQWAYFRYGPITRHGEVEDLPPYERREGKPATRLVTIRTTDERVWRVAPDRIKINHLFEQA